MSQAENNQRVVRAFVDAINAQDWKALERVVAPDFVRHSCAAPGVRSREDLVLG
jgi:limonene-1,2-epoxide hydrolase